MRRNTYLNFCHGKTGARAPSFFREVLCDMMLISCNDLETLPSLLKSWKLIPLCPLNTLCHLISKLCFFFTVYKTLFFLFLFVLLWC